MTRYLIVFSLLWTAGCNPWGCFSENYRESIRADGPLTAEKVNAYMKAYRALKKGGFNPDYKNLENLPEKFSERVRSAGFKSVAEFIRMNARISIAYSVIQGRSYIQKQKQMQQTFSSEIDSAIREVEQTLKDDDLPGETRESLEQTLADLKNSRRELADATDSDMKWASPVIDYSSDLTTEEDLQIVRRYRSELTELFTGNGSVTEQAGKSVF